MTRLLVTCRFAPHSETERLRVRNGVDVVELERTWTESYAPDCWLARGTNAEVQYGHDTDAIGQVVTTAAHGPWWHADLVIDSDDPDVLDRIKVGTPVSLGARMLKSDEDIDLRLRRVTMAQLQHIAIARPGERARLNGAKITGVTKSRTKSNPLQARLTGAQGHAELYRRVVEDGLEWADAYDQLVDRVDATGSWWLPPTAAYLNRANRGRRLAA